MSADAEFPRLGGDIDIKEFSLHYLSNKCTQTILNNKMLSKVNQSFLQRAQESFERDPSDENFRILNGVINATLKESADITNINLIRRGYKLAFKFALQKAKQRFNLEFISLRSIENYKSDIEHSPHASLSHFHERFNHIFEDRQVREHHLWSMTKDMLMHVVADAFDTPAGPDLQLKRVRSEGAHFPPTINFEREFKDLVNKKTVNNNESITNKPFKIVHPFTTF